LNGASPTSLDKDAYEQLKTNEFDISPLTNPNVFAWFGLVSQFNQAA